MFPSLIGRRAVCSLAFCKQCHITRRRQHEFHGAAFDADLAQLRDSAPRIGHQQPGPSDAIRQTVHQRHARAAHVDQVKRQRAMGKVTERRARHFRLIRRQGQSKRAGRRQPQLFEIPEPLGRLQGTRFRAAADLRVRAG